MRQIQLLLSVLLIIVFINSCTIEKRRYRSGYHIDWVNSGSEQSPDHSKNSGSDTTANAPTREALHSPNSSVVPEENVSKTSIVSPLEEISIVEPIQLKQDTPAQSATEIEHGQIQKSTTGEQQKGGMGVLHPDAGASFLLGLLSVGSIVAMFLLGLSPFWAIAALFVIGLACGYLAIYLARRAMNDFYQGRDRYSGQPLAIAGMILGVLSLVVLIGAIVILLLSLIFVNLT